jgi:hypothetical protein
VPSQDLFTVNDDWVSVGSFLCAVMFVLASIGVTRARRTGSPINGESITNAFLRGVSAFPLGLFALTPLFPVLGDAARDSNALLLSVGAANGLITVIADWWRNT